MTICECQLLSTLILIWNNLAFITNQQEICFNKYSLHNFIITYGNLFLVVFPTFTVSIWSNVNEVKTCSSNENILGNFKAVLD